MAETTTCSLEDLGDVLAEEVTASIEDGMRARLTAGLEYIHERIVDEAPRYRGDFADSVEPYVRELPPTWDRGGSEGATAQPGAAAAVMADWKPGDECGVGSDAPYSRKLMLHAGDIKAGTRSRGRKRKRTKYTVKVSPGWVDRIVEEANRLMETGGGGS